MLAQQMGWLFYDGDDFHSAANLAKMRGGAPLTDPDRWPWLLAIRARMQDVVDQRGHAVVACSALKRAHRDALRLHGARFVYLRGDAAAIRERLERRADHFFASELLASQLEILEEPEDALVVDAAQSPDAIVREVVAYLATVAGDDEQP
jgi:gluconokinase